MTHFVIYPAIDLRNGQVVRLRSGDPTHQVTYSLDPDLTARKWMAAGAEWLHVVNLDAAFGESDASNQVALGKILSETKKAGKKVQLGGGLRSLEAIQTVFDLGVERVILGTAAALQPELVNQALKQFGPEKIAAGLDARRGLIRVRGWAAETPLKATDLAVDLAKLGICTLIFTDISRDGAGQGGNLEATSELARVSGLEVIASGGFTRLDELLAAKKAGLAGMILGTALYEGQLDLRACLDSLKGKE